MAETLLPAVGLVVATLLTGVATLLGVDRYRQKNSKGDHSLEIIAAINNLGKNNQEVRYVKLDRDDREVLLSTAFSLKELADHLESAIKDNRTDHQMLLRSLEERMPK